MSGLHKTQDWPWPHLSRQSKSLMPGSTTLLCGDPGSTKSFLILQSLVFWQEAGVRAKLFALEEGWRYHLMRVLAMVAESAPLLDDAWVRAAQNEVQTLFNRFQGVLDDVGPMIYAPENLGVSLSEVSEWIEAEASSGVRILVVDPITMADEEGLNPWDASKQFMGAVKRTASRHGCSVVLVTHPRKGRSSRSVGMDDLSGGATYARASSSILWLERVDPVTKSIMFDGEKSDKAVNRILHIVKARNGLGAGSQIGLWFDNKTLNCRERGLIVRKAKK